MLAPQSTLGSRSSYTSGANATSTPTRMGGKLRELSEQVECMLLGPWPSDYWDVECAMPTIVCEALTEPVSAPCADCGSTHYFILPIKRPSNFPIFDPAMWDVGTDSSVRLSEAERELYNGERFSIEIRSKVFTQGKNLPTTDSMTDRYHRHSITPEQEIALVLQKLHDSFNTEDGARGARKNLRLVVPPTAGFHVHVGNGVMSLGFPLQTVKDFFKIYVANERSIDSVMETNRLGGSKYAITPLDNQFHKWSGDIPGPVPYNKPHSQFFIQRAFSLLSDKAQGKPTTYYPRYPFSELHVPQVARSAYSFQPSDWLKLIQNAKSIDDLRDTHKEYEHCNTLNFQNLRDFQAFPDTSRRRNGKITVEFRQHAGTIEPEVVLAWVDFDVSMVQFAHVSSPAAMRQILDRALLDPDYDILKLMQDIGCSPSTVDQYRHQLGLAKVGRNYASDRQEEQTRNANDIEDESSELRQHLIDSCDAALNPTNVQDKIHMKFKMGGYGRFTRAYLDAYKGELSEADKQRLTAGTIITEPPNVEDILGNKAKDYGDSEDGNWDAEDMALSPVLQPTAFGSGEAPQRLQTFLPDPLSPNHPFYHVHVHAPPPSPNDTSPVDASDPNDVDMDLDPAFSQPPRTPALAPVAPGDLDLPTWGLSLPPPTRPVPVPRPESVMSRRGCVVPDLDLSATESHTSGAYVLNTRTDRPSDGNGVIG